MAFRSTSKTLANGVMRPMLPTRMGTSSSSGPGTWPNICGQKAASNCHTLDGPPSLADSVMAVAVASRPGMARYRELRALAAVRAGSCDVAVSEFIEMLQFGIERQDGPALVRQCRAMGQASEARPAPWVVERRRGKGSN